MPSSQPRSPRCPPGIWTGPPSANLTHPVPEHSKPLRPGLTCIGTPHLGRRMLAEAALLAAACLSEPRHARQTPGLSSIELLCAHYYWRNHFCNKRQFWIILFLYLLFTLVQVQVQNLSLKAKGLDQSQSKSQTLVPKLVILKLNICTVSYAYYLLVFT